MGIIDRVVENYGNCLVDSGLSLSMSKEGWFPRSRRADLDRQPTLRQGGVDSD